MKKTALRNAALVAISLFRLSSATLMISYDFASGPKLRGLLLILILGLANPLLARAGKITVFDLLKGHFYNQTDGSPPLISAVSQFSTHIYLDLPLTTAEAIVFLPGTTLGTYRPPHGATYRLNQTFIGEARWKVPFHRAPIDTRSTARN